MRVLSLIFFPFYVVMQVIMPLYFFSTFYYDNEWSLASAFDMINDTAKKWIIGLSISVVVLFGIIAYGIHFFVESIG